ncbi:MAG: chemotaxis protein CheW [Verrucomicrobiae bacterium]|nr:chemotaxis protein CheW [Verrucomicrobiae bacterium]
MSEAILETKAGTRNLTGKYLTFTLQGESYGIEVLKVREIIRHVSITAVPQMPAYIRGVINLRGKIIPVMDLRRRFDFQNITDTDQTCTVVVQVTLPDGKNTPMGLEVDGVEEVINLNAADIEETPDFGGQIAIDYILGMAKVKGVVKVLLDIDRVVGADALKQLKIPIND